MTLIGKQRVVIGMYDGLGMDYLEASPLPSLRYATENGFFKRVSAVFPTVDEHKQRIDLLRRVAQRTWHHGQFLLQ